MNHEIIIEDHSYNPAMLTISVGDTVTWHNRDAVRHTATRTDPPPFDTGLIQSGTTSNPQQFLVATNNDGIGYFCRPHPFMQGVVVVSNLLQGRT